MGAVVSEIVKPYGGTLNDGKIQVSFTLPTALNDESRRVALEVVERMGLVDSMIVPEKQLSYEFTFFIIYGKLLQAFEVHPVKNKKVYSIDEIKAALYNLEAPLIVIGATTGTDAHTVGLDAIMNIKGIMGNKGLESYPNVICINMGAQVSNIDLMVKASVSKADVILVSQTVTENNLHVENLRELKRLVDTKYPEYTNKIYIGGARITNDFAQSEGFIRGFGAGTMPKDVMEAILLDLGILGGTKSEYPQATGF